MKRLARALACALVVGLAGVGAGAIPATAGQSRVVVVIDTGAGVRQVTISFSGEISGLEALARAGANPVTSAYAGQGLAVCALDGVGHDPSSCLGTPSDPQYWAYHRASGSATGWSYSRGGAGGAVVRDGDVEGWRFGTGAAPRVGVCDVKDCSPPTPAPAPGPAPAPPPVAPAGDGGSGAAGATAPGTGAATAPPDGSESGVADGLPEGAAAESVPSTRLQPRAAGRERDRGRGAATRALGLPRPDDDTGAGSPVGVLAAVAIVGAIVGVALALRRRGRRPA